MRLEKTFFLPFFSTVKRPLDGVQRNGVDQVTQSDARSLRTSGRTKMALNFATDCSQKMRIE